MKLSLIIPALFAIAATATTTDEYETTVTSTTVPVVTAVSTLQAQEELFGAVYIYTNDEGVLTTETIFTATTIEQPDLPEATTPADPAASEGNLEPTTTPTPDDGNQELVIPPGDYITSTFHTSTVLAGGETVGLDLVVLYTEEC